MDSNWKENFTEEEKNAYEDIISILSSIDNKEDMAAAVLEYLNIQ